MAKRRKNIKADKSSKPVESPFKGYWVKENYFLLILGIIALFVGFYFMTMGDWDSTSSLYVSPIILFIAYVVILPAAIFFRKKQVPTKSESE